MDHGTTDDAAGKELGKVIRIDEAKVQDHLGEMVRRSVEDTLNGLLDAEAQLGRGGQERLGAGGDRGEPGRLA